MTTSDVREDDELAKLTQALLRHGHTPGEVATLLRACAEECAKIGRKFTAARFRASAVLIAANDQAHAEEPRRAA